MTCFWDGTLKALGKESSPDHIRLFIRFLKHHNKKTPNIMWNDETLSSLQQEENMKAISLIDEMAIHHGYDCSTCDPVLFLVCELFNISVHHDYNGKMIKYTNKLYPTKVVRAFSNQSHFWT